MRVKSGGFVRSWSVRVVVLVILFAILMLNVKVLTRKRSQSESEEEAAAIVNDPLFLPLKSNGRRNLKQSRHTVDDHEVQWNGNGTQVQVEVKKVVSDEEIEHDNIVGELGPPISQPRNCGQPHCKEFLRGPEIVAMNKCAVETSKRTVNGKLKHDDESELKENDCNFMNGSKRLPVALASTSGSGNTWIRGLLEKATGICTGFLYCDYAMRREGFIGEAIKSGNALVVKTHTVSPKWHKTKQKHTLSDDPYYGAAVYILRNPYKSMIAEWNRKVTYDMLRLPNNESHTNVLMEKFWRKYIQIIHRLHNICCV